MDLTIEQLENLRNLLEGMDVPEQRKSDVMWLSRNLFIRNSNCPNFDKAIGEVKKLARHMRMNTYEVHYYKSIMASQNPPYKTIVTMDSIQQVSIREGKAFWNPNIYMHLDYSLLGEMGLVTVSVDSPLGKRIIVEVLDLNHPYREKVAKANEDHRTANVDSRSGSESHQACEKVFS